MNVFVTVPAGPPAGSAGSAANSSASGPDAGFDDALAASDATSTTRQPKRAKTDETAPSGDRAASDDPSAQSDDVVAAAALYTKEDAPPPRGGLDLKTAAGGPASLDLAAGPGRPAPGLSPLGEPPTDPAQTAETVGGSKSASGAKPDGNGAAGLLDASASPDADPATQPSPFADEAALADAAATRRHDARTARHKNAAETDAAKSSSEPIATDKPARAPAVETPRPVQAAPSAPAPASFAATIEPPLSEPAPEPNLEIAPKAESPTRLPPGPSGVETTRATAAGLRMDAEAVAQIAQRFAHKAKDGATRFEVRLDPPELGRVDVKLDIDAEGRARAALTVERPEALSELQRNARALERALAEAGVTLERDGLSFSLSEGTEGETRDDGEESASSDNAGAQRDPSETDARARQVHIPEETVEFRAGGYAVLRRARLDVQV